MLSEALATLVELKEALDQAGIQYMVVGSLASSVHGLPRATRDADLIVILSPQQVPALARALGDRFYFSEDAARQAIRHASSFNVIHEETFFQADLFVMKPSLFHASQFERREYVEVVPDPGVSLPFQSAEDCILSKLDWFRQGGGVSERQWQDVMGILRVQGDRLDLAYLRRWAAELGVSDLLRRAMERSGLEETGSASR